MTRRRVALATYSKLPGLAPDDHPLVPALAALGIAAEPVVWDDEARWWNGFDAVVVRSCWDYHLRIDRFLAWLAAVESDGVPVINAARLLRWNADKRYLLDLAARGIPIVPTRLVPRGASLALTQVLTELDLDEAVVKPAVSASAHSTWRTDLRRAEVDEPQFRAVVAAGDVLVQPLLPEVVETGEWSLVCFGGEPSHAVLKRPAPGDWRVQGELGGSAEIRPAPAGLAQSAARILEAAGAGASTYARVDGCQVDGGFRLMELELIEPQLYLGLEPCAPGRFAAAIAAALP
jgi:glutathione synthase/RimK-type ligase-like ATP-grasp enzyme